MRLVNGDDVLAQNVNDDAAFEPVHQGSSEAIYFKALCGKDPPPAEAVDDAGGGG